MNAKSAIDAFGSVAAKSPAWFAVIIVSAMGFGAVYHQGVAFENYLETRERREEQLASLRISQCHTVQDRATTVLDQVSKRLEQQEIAFREFARELRDLNAEVRRK